MGKMVRGTESKTQQSRRRVRTDVDQEERSTALAFGLGLQCGSAPR